MKINDINENKKLLLLTYNEELIRKKMKEYTCKSKI